MTEIQKEPEKRDTSPFQEGIVLENYFPGANRDEVLFLMQEAVQSGVALMVVTGDEGCGKTMMCRMLEHQAPPSCTTVLFPRTVDSFEDVVKSVSMRLGLNAPDSTDSRNIDEILEEITGYLKRESKDLLVVFDEAENIYLATLERIRKMLDRINGLGARMHILFSGRKTFLENCDQLSICDFQINDELRFELSPLSEEETAGYLKKCGERLVDGDGKNIFSAEDAKNIYGIAEGNFRMTNFLAEESLISQGDDTPVKELFETVKDTAEIRDEPIEKVGLADLLKQYSDYLPWVGAVLCSVLLVIFLIKPGQEESHDRQSSQQTVETEILVANSAKRSQVVDQEVQQEAPAAEAQPAEVLIVEPVTKEEKTEEEPAEIPPMKIVAEQLKDKKEIVEPAVELEQTSPPDSARQTEQSQVEIEAGDYIQTEKKVAIVELHPTRTLKRKPESPLVVQTKTTKEQPQMKKVVPQRTEVQKTVVSPPPGTVDHLLRKRLLAGATWDSGQRDGMYTVQLMVLASRDAENNLKKMLALGNYRQEAGNFYIFKKETTPENIYIFYGEYPSISLARLAQNSLPRFLRDHKPYVISIKGAVDKMRQ